MKNINFVRVFGFLLIFAMASSFAAPALAQSKKDRDRAKKVAKQGDDLFNKKDYRGAIEKYAQAIVYVPGFAAAHYWKAVAHYYLKENDQALVDFDAALASGYDKPAEIYRIRWLIYYQKGDLDGALRDASEVARIEPKNANIQFALGGIYRDRKQYEDALAAYKRSVQIDPNQGDIHFFIADCYFNLGDYLNQGFAALDALKYKTKYVGESSYYVADALYRAKKFDEAIPYYETAISVKPDLYGGYGPLADIYRNKSRFSDAIATAKKGLAVYPKDANLYVSLSWFYSMADMPMEASIAAQSAINLDPKIAMGYTNLCRAQNDLKLYS
ncbi:MAG TPA: tetratricopeptide repeat protein, partial [Pyrinomonadaceae bacterium]|nr:tetratricopeptide repeat protein [Pyrinomonadaceae bacterium]